MKLEAEVGSQAAVPKFDIELDSKLLLTPAQAATLRSELSTVLQRIGRAGDPPTKIFIGSDFRSPKVTSVASPEGIQIRLDAGYLPFLNNESELAGVLATELSKTAWRFEEAAGRAYAAAFGEASTGGQPSANDLRGALKRLEGDASPEAAKTRSELELALAYTVRREASERVEGQRLKDRLKRAGMDVDLSGSTRRDLESALKAVDRLVQGGYDPWGLISPRKRLVALERSQTPSKIVKRFLNKGTRNAGEDIDTELEILRNYLLYVETKQVDITQLPHRRALLGPASRQLQLRGVFAQSAFLGPAAREVLGLAVVSGLVGLGATKFQDVAPHLQSKLIEAKNGGGPLLTLPSPEKTYQATAEMLAPLPEPMQKAATMGLEHIGMHGTEYLTQYLIPGATVEWATNFVASRYPRQYAAIVSDQSNLLSRQLRLGGKAPDPQTLIKLAQDLEIANLRTENIISRTEKTQLSNGLFASLYELRIPRLTTPALQALRKSIEAKARQDLGLEKPRNLLEAAQQLADIESQARNRAYNDFVLRLKDPAIEYGQKVNLETYLFNEPIRRIHLNSALLPWIASQLNVELFLGLVERSLASDKLSAADRAQLGEALARLPDLEHAAPRVRNHYLEVLRKHFPEGYERGRHQALASGLMPTDLSPVARSYLQTLPRQRVADQELLSVFRQLSAHNLNLDAAQFLAHDFERLLAAASQAGPAERDAFYQNVQQISDTWAKLPQNAVQGAALKAQLFGHLMGLEDPKLRHGFATRILPLFTPRKGRDPSFAERALDVFVTKYLDELRGEPLFDAATELKGHYGADATHLAGFLADRLELDPTMLDEPGLLERVVADDNFWIRSEFKDAYDGSLEGKILAKYRDQSHRYEAYRYHPSQSERIQRILLEARTRLGENFTPEQDLEFWQRLSARGPTGLTDEYFASTWRKLPDSTLKTTWADRALKSGQVWNESLRGELYADARGDKLNPEALHEAEEKALERIRSYASHARSEHDDRFWKQSFLRALRNGGDPSKSALLEAGQRFVKDLALAKTPLTPEEFVTRHEAEIRRGARRNFINQEIEEIQHAFGEGHGFITALENTSRALRTEKAEALAIRDKILAASRTQDKDFGSSIINELVGKAVDWPKADKWALMRWLRGTGPIPNRLAPDFRRVGPESVRRLYTTLPIALRQAFMSALLASPQKGILEGWEKNLFYEQVLNEILPRNESSARIANDVLSALLKSVATVSHPEKKNAVLAYLLANQGEQSNTGSVLRNALEAYGVPGVKMAQLLASSDVLPEDIRRELARARDRSKEPYRHEIFERIEDTLKNPNFEQAFKVHDLIGAASVKYAVSVVDKGGGEHVIQIKREEAEVSIARDFEQLDLMIRDLVQKDPGRYAFLKGMIEATKAAIWRELPLLRESEKTKIATEEYERIHLKNGVAIEIPRTSDLIQKVGGPDSRFFYLRSAEFAPGQGFDSLPAETKPLFAEAILEAEHELLFPADDRKTHIDPDRHPGNARNEVVAPDRLVLHPIDFGQLLELTPADRERTLRLMSYSQLLEILGPEPSLVRKIHSEFLPNQKISQLEARLKTYYPNTSTEKRSSLGPYYNLISTLEDLGFDRRLIHYDFIKAIYQLEPYEAELQSSGRSYRSPKATLAKKVEATARSIGLELQPSQLDRIRYVVTNPQAATVAARNLKAHVGAETTAPTPDRGPVKSSPKERRKIDLPSESRAQALAVADTYFAELINAVYWSLLEKNPARAEQWLQSLFTVEKHVGFASFAVTSAVARELSLRTIPMSHKQLRFFAEHGFSMAVGMQAAEISRRILLGEDARDVMQEVISAPHLAEVGFSTTAFMASGAAVDAGLEAVRPKREARPRELGCRDLWFRILSNPIVKMSATFIGAEAIERSLGEEGRRRGWIPESAERALQRVARKYEARLRTLDAEINRRVEAARKRKDPWQVDAWKLYGNYEGVEEMSFMNHSHDDSLQTVVDEYKDEILALSAQNWDPKSTALFEAESKRLWDWFDTLPKARGWPVSDKRSAINNLPLIQRLEESGYQNAGINLRRSP